MNEKIKVLLEQTGGFVDINRFLGGEKGCVIHTYDGLEKFAKLIVQECAGIYSKIDNGNSHMGTDDYLGALQKHFGDEE